MKKDLLVNFSLRLESANRLSFDEPDCTNALRRPTNLMLVAVRNYSSRLEYVGYVHDEQPDTMFNVSVAFLSVFAEGRCLTLTIP